MSIAPSTITVATWIPCGPNSRAIDWANRTQPEFRRSEGSKIGPAAQRRGCAGVQHRAALARQHVTDRFASEDEPAEAPQAPDFLELVCADLEQGLAMLRARVEHRYFDWTVLPLYANERIGHVLLHSHVNLHPVACPPFARICSAYP
jgi:hypothetical protein